MKKYITIAYTAVLFLLTSWPSKALPGNVNDKTAHFVSFGLLAFLWLWAGKSYKWVLIAGVTFGYFIEVWQWLLPESFHRGYELLDAVADAVGVLIGVLLFYIYQKIAPKGII